MYGEASGQVLSEVGKGGLENGRNGFRNVLWEESVIGTQPRSKATHLDVVEGENDWLKFKLNGCFKPVLPGDGDPFAVG